MLLAAGFFGLFSSTLATSPWPAPSDRLDNDLTWQWSQVHRYCELQPAIYGRGLSIMEMHGEGNDESSLKLCPGQVEVREEILAFLEKLYILGTIN
jgi:predicted transcriptional regulator